MADINNNSDITLEGIIEKFQGGDKTNPLDVDDINALDNTNAINLIIDNKLPLTDEARGALYNLIKFAPEEYRNNFKSIYFDETESSISIQDPLALDSDQIQQQVTPTTEAQKAKESEEKIVGLEKDYSNLDKVTYNDIPFMSEQDISSAIDRNIKFDGDAIDRLTEMSKMQSEDLKVKLANKFSRYIPYNKGVPVEQRTDKDRKFVTSTEKPEGTELNLKISDADKDGIPDSLDQSIATDALVAGDSKMPKTRAQKFGDAGSALLKGAGAALDAIGGPGAIISYIMGKKGLKAAMKEVQPQASAQLSPMFMQHLRQTRELAKKGFHPDQAQKFRKELDKSYQIGLENAVRGSGGQRAKFLAQSGVLDAQRSSALLDYAVRDEELQAKNQEKYEKMMLFKENFDIQRTEKERAEDMERQVADKKAAAGFTSAAFTNLLSGFGRSSLVPNPAPGTTQLYDTIQNLGK